MYVFSVENNRLAFLLFFAFFSNLFLPTTINHLTQPKYYIICIAKIVVE